MNLTALKFSIIFLFFFKVVYAADVNNYQDNKHTNFPEKVSLEYNDESITLVQTGETIRKKFFLKIYSMAHYIEQTPISSPDVNVICQAMLDQSSTKQISMIFLRSLTAEQIQESLISGIKLNTNEAEYAEMLPQMEIFMRAIYEDVNENDEFVLRWFPDGTIVSLFQGKEISSIKDENFTRALWSIWFGNYSVIDRNELIKELLTSS